MMINQIRRLYEFGPFRLDPAERSLTRDGEAVALPPKVFDTLVALVENSGRLVDKDTLMSRLWPDAFVEEATLARHISDLRKVLGETASENKYIETVPRHGYRFVAEVRELRDSKELTFSGPAPVVEKPPRLRLVSQQEEQTETPPAASGAAPSRQRVAVLVAAVALALTAAIIYLWQSGRGGASDGIRTIAVLPFKPISPAGRDEYLEFGMAETLITKLSNVHQLVVRPMGSVRKYAELDQDPLAAGRALQSDFVLEGSLQKKGERIRVTARLVQVSDGQSLWAATYDENSTDVFRVQEVISAQMARALDIRLTGDEKQRLARRETDNLEAYHLYLQGRYIWSKRRREGYEKAIEYFNRAIEKDPAYALAYAGLADCYALGGGGRSGRETYPKARAAALRALEIDETLAEARASLGLVKMFYDWDLAAAEADFRRALDLNPQYATAYQWHADCLSVLGRADEALAQMKRAREIEPLSEIIIRDTGRILYYARRYDEAIEPCRTALEMNPRFYPALLTLGDIYVQKQRHGEAIAQYQNAVSLTPNMALMKALLARAYSLSGKTEEAQKILDELTAPSKERPTPAFDLAVIYTGLGRKDEAFAWLDRAYQERFYRLIYIGVDPLFDPLRADPRFADLLRLIGSHN